MPKRSNGEGSIFRCKSGRHKGKYVAQLTLGWNADHTKPSRARKMSTRRSEVAAWLKEAIEHRDTGQPVVPTKQSFTDFLKTWLEWKKERVRYNTYRSAESLLRTHAFAYFNNTPIGTLTAHDLDNWLTHMVAQGDTPSARTQTYAFVRMALKQALKWGMITRDPTAAVDQPPTSTPKAGKPFTPEEARRFMDTVRGDPYEALYLTTLALGLRRGEAVAIMWDDIDFTRNEVHIARQLQSDGGTLYQAPTKTRGSNRFIFLPDFLVRTLQEQRAHQESQQQANLALWHDTGYVFTDEVGKPISADTYYREYKRALSRAGLAGAGLHDLRRTAASILHAAGVDLLTISRIMGHSNTAITERLYTLSYDSTKRAGATRMNEALAHDGSGRHDEKRERK